MAEGGVRRGGGPNIGPGGGGGGDDLISALPEDLLLQVLVRLRCARAAARTSLLARRWRGLWTRLPDLVFRDVALDPLLHALQAAAAGPGATLLDICIVESLPGSQSENARYRERVSTLLHAAARLSPVELRLAVRSKFSTRCSMDMKVPHLHRATSVDLRGLNLAFHNSPYRFRFRRATAVELQRLDRVYADPRDTLPALERLSLSCCTFDLTDLVLRCPRLRVLREAHGQQYKDVFIRSASLQELHMEAGTPFMHHIHIEAPALKQLALSFGTGFFGVRVGVSVSAPLLEQVSWRCTYTALTVGLGRWGLCALTLMPVESGAHGDHAHVLSLYLAAHSSHSFPEAAAELTTEVEKHMIVHFSVLELHLATRGHAFITLALHLLGMHLICTDMRSLKIVLCRSEDKEACPVNCPCDQPRNWQTQSISLTNLENVEIKGFEGEGHEFDFLELIFRCAKTLKSLTVRQSDEVTTSNDWCTKVNDMFKAYPSVKCNIDLTPGPRNSSAET